MKLHRNMNYDELSLKYMSAQEGLSLEQSYYIIPYWIRDVFRDNNIPYIKMLDEETVSKHIPESELKLWGNTVTLVRDFIYYFSSRKSIFNDYGIGNKINNYSFYPLKDIYKHSWTYTDDKCNSNISNNNLIKNSWFTNTALGTQSYYSHLYRNNDNRYTPFQIYIIDDCEGNIPDNSVRRTSQAITDIFSRFDNATGIESYYVAEDKNIDIYSAMAYNNLEIKAPIAHTKSIMDKGYSIYRIDDHQSYIFLESNFFLSIETEWVLGIKNFIKESITSEWEKVESIFKDMISPNTQLTGYNTPGAVSSIVLPYGLDGRYRDYNRIGNKLDFIYFSFGKSDRETSFAYNYFKYICNFFYDMNKTVLNDAYSYESFPRLARTYEFQYFVSGI